jgi:hypothetical protein
MIYLANKIVKRKKEFILLLKKVYKIEFDKKQSNY